MLEIRHIEDTLGPENGVAVLDQADVRFKRLQALHIVGSILLHERNLQLECGYRIYERLKDRLLSCMKESVCKQSM